MKRVARILVTGAGAPGTRGTAFALRSGADLDGLGCEIVGSDLDVSRISASTFDSIEKLPAATDPHYLDGVNRLVERYQLDLILPQTTAENVVLSSHQAEIACPIVTSPTNSIEKANNKFLVAKTFSNLGYPVPDFRLTSSRGELLEAISSFGFPEQEVVVKLLSASGGRGVRILTNTSPTWQEFSMEKPSGMHIRLPDLLAALEQTSSWPQLLVMERLSGEEVTVDVYRGRSGEVVVPRKRTQIRTGISTITDVYHDSELSSMVLDVSAELGLCGVFGFQFMLKDNRPMILECNPRVQGTMVASMATGNNLIWMAVRDKIGLGGAYEIKSDWGPSRLIRHWGGSLRIDGRVVEF